MKVSKSLKVIQMNQFISLEWKKKVLPTVR